MAHLNCGPACAVSAVLPSTQAKGLAAGKPLDHAYKSENLELVKAGCVNLARHIKNARSYGQWTPPVGRGGAHEAWLR